MIPSRWAAALFCLWIVVISYRYGNTVVRAFYSPFNPGSDIEWLAGWLLTAIVMIALAAAVKRAVAIVYLILAATCVLILILSGTLLAAIAAGAILVVGHLAGRALLLFLGVESGDVALTIPLGLIVPALLGFILAALHWLTPLAIGLLLPGLTVAAVYVHRTFRTRDIAGGPRSASAVARSLNRPPLQLPLLLIAPVIFLNLTWAVAPEIQFDANNYHLAVSQIYLRNRGFIDLQYFFHSYFHHFIDMVFTLALALHGAAAAKLLSFAFSLIAAAAVFSLGKLVFDEPAGAWAAAFFYTTPVVSWLSGTAYIDNAVALFLTATVIAFLRWHRSQEKTGWLYAASLLAGATVAAKVNAVFGLPVMFVIALWRLRTRPGTLAVCALLIGIVAMPWYGLIYHWTGNPVFPMLNGFFKSPLWDFENRVMDANAYGIGISPAALLRLPFRLTWNTTRFGIATPQGAAGMMLLLAFPFAFVWLSARKQNAAILLTTASVFFLLWAFGFQNVRYYVHILPVVCVLGAATVFHFSKSRWSGIIARICLVTVLVLQYPGTSMEFWNIPERFPITTALGLEPHQEFLRRSLDSYAGAERLNAVVKPGERVIGVDVEDVRFYLDAPLETLSDSTLNSVLRTAAFNSDETLLRTLHQSGFGYIFARRESLKDLPAWYPYLKPQFLDQFATLVFRDGNTVVYRLNS